MSPLPYPRVISKDLIGREEMSSTEPRIWAALDNLENLANKLLVENDALIKSLEPVCSPKPEQDQNMPLISDPPHPVHMLQRLFAIEHIIRQVGSNTKDCMERLEI